MSEPKSAHSDPSMDDILASIRKIISDDEARAQVKAAAAGGPRPPAARAVDPDAPQPELGPGAGNGRDDVLLLTDVIEEPPAGRPATAPPPRIDPVRAGEMPQPALGPDPAAAAALVGSGTAAGAAQAFARLSQVVQERVPPAAADAPSAPAGAKTVEDLARELLRPMLQEWLDRNLPPLVERLVEREIDRLTRR